MRRDPVQEELDKTGLELTKGERKAARPSDALNQKPHKVSARWPYACARIKRICEGAQPRRGHTFETACKTATMPKLAHAFMELYTYYVTRSRQAPLAGTDHNPFRHLSDEDAHLKFQRLVEDICDKSSVRLGSWFVK